MKQPPLYSRSSPPPAPVAQAAPADVAPAQQKPRRFARVRRHAGQLALGFLLLAALAWMARVCTFLWDIPRAQQLYPLLLPYADRNIVLGADSQACLGSAERYLALLAATMGRVEDADRHFRAAIAMNERMGARPVLACCQHEYARLLQHRDMPGDRALARALLATVSGEANVITGTDPGLGEMYYPVTGSPVIDRAGAIAPRALEVQGEYVPHQQGAERVVSGAGMDLGAFEARP